MPRGVKSKEKRCAYCPRTFIKEEHLRRHERTHTGEKPFKCGKCDRRYSRSDVLTRHMQIHSLNDIVQVSPIPRPADIAPANSTRLGDRIDHMSSNDSSSVRGLLHKATATRSDNHGPPMSPNKETVESSSIRPSSLVPGDYYAEPPSLLPTVDATLESSPPATPQQLSHEYIEEGTRKGPTILPDLRGGTSDPRTSVTAQENWPVLPHLSSYDADSIAGLDVPLSDRHTPAAATASSSPNAQLIGAEQSFQQMIHRQETANPGAGQSAVSEVAPMRSTCAYSQSARSPYAGNALIQLQPDLVDDLDAFLFDPDLASHGYLSSGVLDYLSFTNLFSPLTDPACASADLAGTPSLLFSPEQVRNLRLLWREQRSAPCVRIIRTLWQTAVQHPADNIFSKPSDTARQGEMDSTYPRASRSGIGEDCRKRLRDFCRDLDEKIRPHDVADLTPTSNSMDVNVSANAVSPLPGWTVDGFPSVEILDASLDFYFLSSPLPFLHRSTFHPGTIPEPLLLSTCLTGLSSLYPERSKAFVLDYLTKLMRFCRSDLTTKALGHCPPWDLLVSIASTLLVTYLGLGFLEDLDDSQVHMIAVQLLHIAEKHGLFKASDGENLATQLRGDAVQSHGSWTAWSRTESIKRMISCLLWIDMGYARLMGSGGVVDMDKVELHLPCDSSLFDAANSYEFSLHAQRGAQLSCPRIQTTNFHINAPSTMNQVALETLLVGLYLQTAALRRHSPSASLQLLEPHDVFAGSTKAKQLVETIWSLPSKYANLFRGRYRATACAWHNICLTLVADLDLLEIACGRDGVEAAQRATRAVAKWAQTSAARRATLHAAQIFDILSMHRSSESYIVRPDLLLLNCALVVSLYFFVCRNEGDYHDRRVYELLQPVNWTVIGAEGLRAIPQIAPPSPPSDVGQFKDPAHAARDFVRYGGPVSFTGETSCAGEIAARKIFLNYARLLDDIGKWRGSRYAQLLRTMSDFVVARRE